MTLDARGEAVDTLHWRRAVNIRVAGYTGSGALTNFPLLVTLNPAAISGFDYSGFKPDGSDLRFTDAVYTAVLPHEIEAWNTSGFSRVWVRVPSLVSNTVIRAFWSNLEAEQPESASVWDAGFAASGICRALWPTPRPTRTTRSTRGRSRRTP
jgi:hypothetical protein